jgi:hypothetical protein
MIGRKLSRLMLCGALALSGCGSGSEDGESGAMAGAGGDNGFPEGPDEPNDPGSVPDPDLGGYQTPPPSYQTPPPSYQTPPSSYQTPPSSYQPPGSGVPPAPAPEPCSEESSCTGCEDYCEECICNFGRRNCNDICQPEG